MRVYVVTRAWSKNEDTETFVDSVFSRLMSAQDYCARMNDTAHNGWYEYYECDVEN